MTRLSHPGRRSRSDPAIARSTEAFERLPSERERPSRAANRPRSAEWKTRAGVDPGNSTENRVAAHIPNSAMPIAVVSASMPECSMKSPEDPRTSVLARREWLHRRARPSADRAESPIPGFSPPLSRPRRRGAGPLPRIGIRGDGGAHGGREARDRAVIREPRSSRKRLRSARAGWTRRMG